MSRPITSKEDATSWKEFCELQEKNPNHEFFLVEKENWK